MKHTMQILIIFLIVSSIAATSTFSKTVDDTLYLINNFPVHTFDNAIESCTRLNMSVVEIKSEDDFLKLRRVMARAPRKPTTYWLGLTDANIESQFEWVTSKRPLQFDRFAPNEPNNGELDDFDEDCVEINSDLEWNDVACTKKIGIICVKEPKEVEESFDYGHSGDFPLVEDNQYFSQVPLVENLGGDDNIEIIDNQNAFEDAAFSMAICCYPILILLITNLFVIICTRNN